MTPYLEYLIQGILPSNKEKVQKIVTQFKKYTIIQGALYQKNYDEPWLKYLPSSEAHAILRKLHEGKCDAYFKKTT